MPFPFKSALKFCVKIIAVITATIGICVYFKALAPSFNWTSECIVSGKSIAQTGAYCIDFHPPGRPDETAQYYFSHPSYFYEEAQAGDRLQVATIQPGNLWSPGYRRLVRNGRVVARAFSDDQFREIFFIGAAILPLLVFLPCRNEELRMMILAAAALAEIMVIALALLFILLAYAFSHGSLG